VTCRHAPVAAATSASAPTAARGSRTTKIKDRPPPSQRGNHSLVPASGRNAPPYHGTSKATGGSRRQRIWLVLAFTGPGRFASGCDRLQPRGSIKAPSEVVSFDDFASCSAEASRPQSAVSFDPGCQSSTFPQRGPRRASRWDPLRRCGVEIRPAPWPRWMRYGSSSARGRPIGADNGVLVGRDRISKRLSVDDVGRDVGRPPGRLSPNGRSFSVDVRLRGTLRRRQPTACAAAHS
jgi:hypothetical protein